MGEEPNLNKFDQKTDKLDIPLSIDNLHITKHWEKQDQSFSHPKKKYAQAVESYITFLYWVLEDCERIEEKEPIIE